jgi:hypothetical protein
LLQDAIQARRQLLDPPHDAALRLFSGFTEGCPDLVVDMYGKTAVFHNHADPPSQGEVLVQTAVEILRAELPWVQAGLVKTRSSRSADERAAAWRWSGADDPDCEVRCGMPLISLNQDCSFIWIRAICGLGHRAMRMTVLNTFAYTGSLGWRPWAAFNAQCADRTQRFLTWQSFLLPQRLRIRRRISSGRFLPRLQAQAQSPEFDCVI